MSERLDGEGRQERLVIMQPVSHQEIVRARRRVGVTGKRAYADGEEIRCGDEVSMTFHTLAVAPHCWVPCCAVHAHSLLHSMCMCARTCMSNIDDRVLKRGHVACSSPPEGPSTCRHAS